MKIMKRFKSMRDSFDRYAMASAYAEADCSQFARELLKDREQPCKRPKIRQRPRLELRLK
jgi:hypothetical protein